MTASPTLTDLQAALSRAETELACADMIDSTIRRDQQLTYWNERVGELKRQIAELGRSAVYTPGTWTAGTILVDGKEPSDEAVVYVGGDADSGPATEIVIKGANAGECAVLIAAAPDMLAVLLAFVDDDGRTTTEMLKERALAAIAKAEGPSNG